MSYDEPDIDNDDAIYNVEFIIILNYVLNRLKYSVLCFRIEAHIK